MMMTQFRTVISLVLIQCAVSMRPLITCETPGSVNEGVATFLTCNYNRNLSRTKQDFYVYKVHNDTSEPVIVTLCKWDNNAWNCDTDDSYKVLTADINNQVIVEIPSAKQSLSGTYFCKTLSVDTNSTHRGCNLTVRILITFCTWDGDTVNCDVDNDYAMTTVVTSSQVTLEIKSANLIHSGRYICKTLPLDQLGCSYCSVTVLSAGKGGTELGWSVVPTPYIVLACLVAVLLVMASVLLIRNHSVVAQRCKREPQYSILKDQSKVSHKDIFVVQPKNPSVQN